MTVAPTGVQAEMALREVSGANAPAAGQPSLGDPFSALMLVPTVLTVEAPVTGLTVRDLFRLDKGSIVVTLQPMGVNVPLRVGGRLLAWGEFQVAGDRLALRIAELA